MMGVYIKGMEMPKEGRLTLQIGADGAVYVVNSCSITEETYTTDAVPVPPHGRLGDLDKLEKMFADIDSAKYSCFDGEEPFYSAADAAQIIRIASTIIPASEEGE